MHTDERLAPRHLVKFQTFCDLAKKKFQVNLKSCPCRIMSDDRPWGTTTTWCPEAYNEWTRHGVGNYASSGKSVSVPVTKLFMQYVYIGGTWGLILPLVPDECVGKPKQARLARQATQGNKAPGHTHAHERPREQGTLPHSMPMNDQGNEAPCHTHAHP